MGAIGCAVENVGLNMQSMAVVLAFCVWLGILIVCTVFIVSGVLRWLSDSNKRGKRLDFAAWISLIVVAVMFFIHKGDLFKTLATAEASAGLTPIIVNASKVIAKLLVLGTVIVCALLLAALVALFVFYVISIFVQIMREQGSGQQSNIKAALKAKSDAFFEMVKTPILMTAITLGVLAMFVIVPLLMGNPIEADGATQPGSTEQVSTEETQEEGPQGEIQETERQKEEASGRQHLTQVWESGVRRIAAPFEKTGESSSFSDALITYILIYIIVLGVCFAIVQILYSVIRDCFTNKNSGGIIDEYSSSIGILAVGIAILWSLKNNAGEKLDDPLKIVGEFTKAAVAATFIVALGILALEIIRLLMDMKEKLIRIEARYLFTSLVGLASILMLSMLNSIYGAVCAVIGFDADASLDNIQDRIKGKMIEEMERQLDEKKDYKMTFSGFSEKITKK